MTTAAKERPILFSGAMVRAIIDGSKTQTRRAAKPQPEFQIRAECQYGQPGDRLWVRETWMADPPIDSSWPSTQFAGCKPRDHSLIPDRYRLPQHCLYRATDPHAASLHGWTPGIHMFRWASRITLEVTGVRVERLKSISEADALAEGVDMQQEITIPLNDAMPWCEVTLKPRSAVEAYAVLWESINGRGAWHANPWVWVVEFKPVKDGATP